jgi:MFS family permease
MSNSLGFGKFSIGLAHGYTVGHAVIYLLGVLLTINGFVFLNSTQGFVLREILGIPKENLGFTTGTLVFYDEIVSMCLVAIWGITSDVTGKYLVFGIGFAITSLSFFLFTFARNLYPELLLYRLLFAFGGAACSSMLTAVLADVANERDRGKFAGLVGLVSGLGALLGVFVFLPMPSRIGGIRGIRTTYLIVGGVCATTAVLLLVTWLSVRRISKQQPLMRAPPQDETVSDLDQPTTHVKEVIAPWYARAYDSAKGGILAARDPKIFLGYAGNFLARADSVSITLFLPLWVYKFYLDNNLCIIDDLDSPEFNVICREAYVRASILSGVTQVFALVGAPFFGYFADKFYRPLVVLTAALTAGIGYTFLSIETNVNSPMTFLYLFFLGFGEIGLIVTSLGLVTHSSVPQQHRGSVAGFASFTGAVGILICSKLGGYLFDVWYKGGAFTLLAIIHFLFLGLGLVAVFFEAKSHGGFNMESFRKMRAVFQHVEEEEVQ